MELQFKEDLKKANVNLEEAINRCMGNEDLYERFLGKFLDDTNFEQLKQNVTEKNFEEAYKNAHTLKGLAANLSIMGVSDASSKVVEAYRSENYNKMEVLTKELEAEYQKICNVLKQYK